MATSLQFHCYSISIFIKLLNQVKGLPVKKLFILFYLWNTAVLPQQEIINRNGSYYLSNTVIIKLKEGYGDDLLKSRVVKEITPVKFENVFTAETGTLYKSASLLNNIYKLEYLSSADPLEVASRIGRIREVLWAEPKYVHRIAYTPNDTRFNSNEQINLLRIFAESAWSISKGDTNVVIAIIDTGVDWTHPDLASNIFKNRNEIPGNGIDEDDGGLYPDDTNGWDFGGLNGTPDNNPVEDPSWRNSYHGTHVAGIAGASTDNSIGIASIGFNCRILPVKVSRSDLRDANDYPFVVYGYEGMRYAADKGAKVINCSWGGYSSSEFEQEVINYAVSKGALVVAAAGNDAEGIPFYPASYSGVLSVGWLNTENDTRSFAANYGKTVDVMAPGTSILSTWQRDTNNNNQLYGYSGGSSMASPLAAGLAGLVFSKFGNQFVSPLQVAEQIRITADNVDAQNPGYEMLLGRGRINAQRALSETGSPSVRGVDVNFIEIGNGNGIYQAGESVEIDLTFINYLSPASNIYITLESDDPGVEITQSVFNTSLSTMESVSNANNRFRFTIKENSEIDHTVSFVLRYSSTGYSDFQILSLKINIPLETHSTSKIQMTITSKGALGYNDYSLNKEGVGFRFLNGGNLMFEGAFMFGISSSKVMDAARIDQAQSADFKTVYPIKFVSPGVTAFQEGYTNFDDSGITDRIGISTHFYSYSYNSPPDENYIIMRTALNNSTGRTIENLYAGFFIDWDIPAEDYANNRTLYDAEGNFAYAFNINNPNVYVGTALISHNNFGYYPIQNDASAGDVRLFDGNGFTDIEKFITLSSGLVNSSPVSGDISYVVSGGPFRIEPGKTESVAFAIAAASTLSELRSSIARSREKYKNDIPTGVEKTEDLPASFSLAQNYPNPFNPSTTIEYSIPAEGFVTLKVYDTLGREIKTLVSTIQKPGKYKIDFNGSDISSGIYFYTLKTGSHIKSAKMVLVK